MFPLLMIVCLSLTLEEQEIEAANVFGGGEEAAQRLLPVHQRPRAHQWGMLAQPYQRQGTPDAAAPTRPPRVPTRYPPAHNAHGPRATLPPNHPRAPLPPITRDPPRLPRELQ